VPVVMSSADQEAFEKVQVGDFFVSSWGYDQTNIDFFVVVGKTAARIKVQACRKERVGGNGYSDSVVPVEGGACGPVMVKKVSSCDRDRKAYFSVNSFAGAWAWDGKAEAQTNSAHFGH
jgi:hypothetical protein